VVSSNLEKASIGHFELPPNFQIDLSLLSSIVELNKLNAANSSFASTTKPASKATEIDPHFEEIPLDSTQLAVKRPNLFRILYDDLALQCKTCGLRFRDTEIGQNRMTEHLDSHFRRNMRLKEKSKRVMARDWFGPGSDWISGIANSVAATEKSVNIFEEASQQDEKLEQSGPDVFVEATEEEQAGLVRCDVCQESVELAWNDDSEQWIIPGCIRSDVNGGAVVHANCLKDMAEVAVDADIDSKKKRIKTIK
jgi:pre-mRNA cleavage complex 2 protein Pcf11